MSYFKGPDYGEMTNFRWDTSVLNLIVEALRKNGDTTAMIEGQTGKTATFRELLQKGSSVAAGLRGMGITAGDYVIVCCDKSITAYSLLLGIIFTGATAILYPIPHIDIIHKLTMGFTIKGVVCDDHYLAALKKSIRLLDTQPSLIITTDPTDKVLSSLLKCDDPFKLYDAKDVDKHIPMIFFSSGTTGDPKGIQFKDSYVQHCGHGLPFFTKSLLNASPMFWMSALMTFLSSVFSNFTFICSNSTDPRENLQLLQNYKVEGWFIGTGSVSRYINEPTLSKYELSSIKRVRIGGEYVVTSVYNDFVTKVLKSNAVVENGYGSTEGGTLAVTQPNETFEIGCCGQLYVGVEVKILDDNQKLLPIGELGEVWLRTPILTPGYWGKPELNKEAFDSDGFLRTGDAGYFDSKGRIHLRGRVGDLINYRGTKISPAEVEDILVSHEAVLEAAVVGKPHSADIQHMTAYVVLNTGFHVSEDELKELVDRKVPNDMQLRGGVHFLSALPRTIIGKVQRKLLRESL